MSSADLVHLQSPKILYCLPNNIPIMPTFVLAPSAFFWNMPLPCDKPDEPVLIFVAQRTTCYPKMCREHTTSSTSILKHPFFLTSLKGSPPWVSLKLLVSSTEWRVVSLGGPVQRLEDNFESSDISKLSSFFCAFNIYR